MLQKNYYKKVLLCNILIILLILSGCSPILVEHYEIPPLEFEEIPEYELDLSNINKPEPINPIYVDDNFKEVPVNKAKYVLLSEEEYAKIGALLELAIGYKDIAKEQVSLVNLRIDQINALRELAELERIKANEYRRMWVDAENQRRVEAHEHAVENATKTAGMVVLGISAAALLFLGL